MPIKRNYNNAHERMEDKAEKAVLPILEQQFIYQLGLRPILSMEYDSTTNVCKVDVAFPKMGGRFIVHYYEHKHIISYPRYTNVQMTQLVERVAATLIGAIQDTVVIYRVSNIKGYAKQLYAQCMEDEETFLTWIDQVDLPVTPKQELMSYFSENRHRVQELLKDEGYLNPFTAILYSFSEDQIKDMSDTTLDYIIKIVDDIRKIHQNN